jgi:hypothetical protein
VKNAGLTWCGVTWPNIWYLEEKVGDRVLTCPGDTHCRWSCSYNNGIYYDNTSPYAQHITGNQLAAEARDLIKHCRPNGGCTEDHNDMYYIRGMLRIREDVRIGVC